MQARSAEPASSRDGARTTRADSSAEASRKPEPRGPVIWLTGLSGAGKTLLAHALVTELVERGRSAYVLDGDRLRDGLCSDLGFAPEDRAENVRRVAHAAALLADAGSVVAVALISPYRADRAGARQIVEDSGCEFLEVFLNTPLEVCERRDPKGLYARARAGQLPEFTGVSAPYEPPAAPDLELRPAEQTPAELVRAVLTHLPDPGRRPA